MTNHREPVISLRGVWYSVDGHTILEDAWCDIEQGEIFGVMGMSGVGKSTLLRLIMGLIRPDRGEVIVLGEDVATMPERHLDTIRRQMGISFQGAALFDSLTVAENVAFGLKHGAKRPSDAEVAARVAEYLEIVGMAEEGDKLPSQLSGGMRKRIGIARALIMTPSVMLYDEPTAGLDPIMSGVIVHLIGKLRAQFGMTSVVVTHEVDELFAIADRVVMLYQGRVVAEDTPENLRCCATPIVKQFVEGSPEGPIRV
ncbi:MAG TPA: ATP-binding cassette domain-containing protein [Armatimonadota bacterium]|jgi:phospholipid/cholesterol/gamma-HCH transport system ATP-binding protein